MFGMRSRIRSAKFIIAVVLGGCVAASVAGWSLSAQLTQGQGRKKTIEKAFTRNDVVEFSQIRVAQKLVEPGKPFDEDDEWLNKVSVRVRNISNKPIVYLSVNFDFPETKSTGSQMTYPVSFGQQPGSRFPQKKDPLFMMPGDSFEISLLPDYAKMKSFVERRHQISQIKKAELRVHFVIFADRTGWAAGNFYKQDPNDPDHYINVGDKPEPN